MLDDLEPPRLAEKKMFGGVARAHAVAGHRDEAIRHIELAYKAGEAIKEDQERKIFFADFDGGNWNQMR